MPIRAPLLLLLCLLAAPPLRAQRAVQPWDVSGHYATFDVEAQVTGPFAEGRDVLASWGRLSAVGPSGAWMPRLGVSAGLRVGSGNGVDRLLVGPQLGLARAFPSLYFGAGRTSRGEPYLTVGAAAYATGDFDGRDAVGVTPALSAGLGFRLLSDEWDTALGLVEARVERRFGLGGAGPELYIRLGQALPRRGRR